MRICICLSMYTCVCVCCCYFVFFLFIFSSYSVILLGCCYLCRCSAAASFSSFRPSLTIFFSVEVYSTLAIFLDGCFSWTNHSLNVWRWDGASFQSLLTRFVLFCFRSAYIKKIYIILLHSFGSCFFLLLPFNSYSAALSFLNLAFFVSFWPRNV